MAKRLGQELKQIKFEAVYTSDLKRTQKTAQYIIDENEAYYPPFIKILIYVKLALVSLKRLRILR